MNSVANAELKIAPAPFMLSKSAKSTGEGKIDGQKKKGLPIRFSSNPFNSRDGFRRARRFPKDNTTRKAEERVAAQI